MLVLKLLTAWLAVTCLVPGVALAEEASPRPGGAPSRELVFLTWSDYIDPDLLAEFERACGCGVKQVYFETDTRRDEILAERNGTGFDLVLASGVALKSYARLGWLEPLAIEKIRNLRHVDARWRSAMPQAEDYGVPYFWGTLGVAFRQDLVDGDILSWMDIFRPASDVSGKLVMLDDGRDLVTMALKALGHSLNTQDRSELREAERLLIEQRPHVKSYAYVSLSEESGLVSGEVVAATVYNGDALMLQEHEPNIRFLVPREGTNLWVDYLLVPRSSRNKDLAWQLIDFLNEPANAARNAQFVHYATPNQAARDLMPSDYLEDPVIFPGEEILAKSEFYTRLTPRVMKLRNSIHARVTQ
jgi:spermidine/putrescine transport system substrate-binding protein